MQFGNKSLPKCLINIKIQRFCGIIYRMSEIKNNIYVGFDFSMNKPAATIYSNGKLFFYLWALNLSEKKLEMYRRCGVNAMSRNLDSIDTKKV